MTLQLLPLLFGAFLLAAEGLAEKGAFEQILEVNFGKGTFII